MSLAQFMAERIFTPLGMVDTAFYVAPEKAPRLATLYDIDPVSHLLVRQSERITRTFLPRPGLRPAVVD